MQGGGEYIVLNLYKKGENFNIYTRCIIGEFQMFVKANLILSFACKFIVS